MFSKLYLEITNVCNLKCSFCPGTRRPRRFLSEGEFRTLAEKLRPQGKYLYFHVMGEPLLHPDLPRFLEIAGELDFRVVITTNGTLLPKRQAELLAAPALHKVNVSLHAGRLHGLCRGGVGVGRSLFPAAVESRRRRHRGPPRPQRRGA